VIVGAALLLLLARGGGTGARERAERSIRGRWDAPAEAFAVADEVEAYVKAHGADPEARWFAAEAWTRVGRPDRAHTTLFGDASRPLDPAAPRRFAALLASVLDHAAGRPDWRTAVYPRLLQARVESGEPGAEAELQAVVKRLVFADFFVFHAAFGRSPTLATEALGRAFLSRHGDRDALVAGATLLRGPLAPDVVDGLAAIVDSSWRQERFPMWQQSVRAIGTSGDPRAAGILRRGLRLLDAAPSDGRPAPPGPSRAHERRTFQVGLALAGDRDVLENVWADLARDQGVEFHALHFARGLLDLWARGDAGAATLLEELWRRAPGNETRLQIEAGSMLADADPAAAPLPWDGFEADLLATEDPVRRTFAHAWALRKKRDGAAAALVADLGRSLPTARLGPTDQGEDPPSTAVLEAIRALLRWS
jgi:hypothetical protein